MEKKKIKTARQIFNEAHEDLEQKKKNRIKFLNALKEVYSKSIEQYSIALKEIEEEIRLLQSKL